MHVISKGENGKGKKKKETETRKAGVGGRRQAVADFVTCLEIYLRG